MSRLDGKVALVTGASTGIGFEVARQLAERGARVVLVARTQSTLERAAEAVGGVAFALDLNELATLEGLPRAIVNRLGRLDIVVNSAGVHHRGALSSQSSAQLVEMIATNLTAPICLSRAALPHLRAGAVIVNVGSLAGAFPVAGQATYGATKAGLRLFSHALGAELAARGIRCAVVCPGPVATAAFTRDLAAIAPIVFSQPLSSPAMVAEAVVACITDGIDEIAVPRAAGVFARLAAIFPRLALRFVPLLERRGAARRARLAGDMQAR